MKYIANLLVTIHNVASAEAMVLGLKAGLDPQMVYDLISAGVGTSRVFEVRGPMMVKNKYENASMSIKLYQKDISVIDDFAEGPRRADAAVLGQPFRSTPKRSPSGLGDRDTAAVCAVLEKQAGVKRRKAGKRG